MLVTDEYSNVRNLFHISRIQSQLGAVKGKIEESLSDKIRIDASRLDQLTKLIKA